MTTLTIWKRRGEEAETLDWHSEHVETCRGPITRADLVSALSAHHEEDLAMLDSDEERADAVDTMVAAYETQRLLRERDAAFASHRPAAPSPRRIAAEKACRDAEALRRAQAEWAEACEAEATP